MLRLEDMYGNDGLRKILRNSIDKNTFPQISLFSGEGGTGKSSIAKQIAMMLTCEGSPKPCCRCLSCRNNITAFGGSGNSLNVRIVNLGLFTDKKDVNELIESVFTLKNSEGNMVYVFEEMHALANIKGAQTAFLAEIDKMPKNVYIIMCTTKPYVLIPELVSRSINFKFAKLNRRQSIDYLRTFGNMDGHLESVIVEHCNGNPRMLKNSAEFVLNNQVSFQEYLEFMQTISDEEVLDIFKASGDVKSYLILTNMLIEQHEPVDVFKKLDSLFGRIFWLLEGAELTDIMLPISVDLAKEIFDVRSIRVIWEELRKYSQNWSREDEMYYFAKVGSLINKLKKAGGFDAKNQG